jgi:hypothetical protein
MSSKLPQNKPGLAVGRDEVGAALGNVEAQIQALQADTSASTAVTVTIPQPCTGGGIGGGGFVLAYEKIKKGLRATFCATAPSDTVRLKTVIIKHSDATASAISFKQNRLQQTIELDSDQTASGHVEYKFQPLLEYNTQYDLIKLVAIATDGTRLQDPPTDAKFGDPPLATFNTPSLFPPPSDPAANLIITNALDSAKAFRAYATFRVFASGADHTATFAQQNIDQIVVTILENGLNVDYPYKIKGADANAVSVDVTVRKLIPGASYQWVKNTAWSPPSQSAESTGAAVSFTGASLSIDPNTLTGVNLNVQFGAPNNAKHAKVSLEFTQPATPVALKNCSVDLKLQSDPDTAYDPKIVKFSLQDNSLVTASQAYTVANGLAPVLDNAMKLNPSTAYTLRLRLNVIGEVIQLVKTFNVGTGLNPDAIPDTGPPSGLGTPMLVYTSKDSLRMSGMTVSQNFNQPGDPAKLIEIWDGGNPGNFLDLNGYFGSPQVIQLLPGPSSAATRYAIGHKDADQVGILLKQLRNLFGAAAFVHGRFYAANQAFGLQPAPSPDGLLDLSKPFDYLDGQGAVNVQNVGQSLISTIDLLYNGHFHFVRGATGACKGWTTNPPGPFVPAIGAGPPLEFDQANHRIKASGAFLLGQRLGDPSDSASGFNVDPGDYLAAGFVLYTDNPHTSSMTFLLQNSQNLTAASASFTASLTTTPTLYQAVVQLPTTQLATRFNGWFWVTLKCVDGTVSSTNNIYIERFGLNRGQTFTAFSPGVFQETQTNNPGDSIFWPITPNFTNSVAADAVDPTGPSTGVATQGGGFPPGFGGAARLGQ